MRDVICFVTWRIYWKEPETKQEGQGEKLQWFKRSALLSVNLDRKSRVR